MIEVHQKWKTSSGINELVAIGEKYRTLYDETLKLISLYKTNKIKIIPSLKGNLGEFIAMKELIKRFKDSKIEYLGGSKKYYDILINDKIKIQVKTSCLGLINNNGFFLTEESADFKPDIFEKIDFIIFLVLDLEDILKSGKMKYMDLYIFNKEDFKNFKNTGWFGKTQNKIQIANVAKVIKDIPSDTQNKKMKSLKEKLKIYDTDEYHRLFRESKDNWDKIKSLLQLS